MKFNDKLSIGELKQLEGGYLVATARVARTGVQEYLASELGDVATSAGFRPSDMVRVYRHPDQVFAEDSLATITRLPVTVNHPKDEVTAENWASLAVGEIGDAYTKESEWIVVNPMIKDAHAAKLAQSTHKELSMGYSAEIVKARDGLDADFEQINIRYNHLALVPRARAGDKARIGDGWGAAPIQDFQPGDSPNSRGGRMPELKTVVLGDKAVQVADTDVAAIEHYKAAMTQKLADAEAAKQQSDAAKDEQIGNLRAELQQAKDAANIDVDALVAARTELVSQVKAMDASIDPAGKSDEALRKAAVAAKLGDAMVQDASPAEITGMFKALSKSTQANPVVGAIQSGGLVTVGDHAAVVNTAQSAYAARLTRKK